MEIRPFAPSDQAACLALGTRAATRLSAAGGVWLVMEHEGEIVGCGGYLLEPGSHTATILGAVIREDLRRMGLGRFLIMYQLREIGTAGASAVRVEAPPEAAGFFAKQGFHPAAQSPGCVEFIKKLTVCA